MKLPRALLLLALPACLDVPAAPTPECSTTADCKGAEVCEEGTCWGDPPEGEFAIVISPPMERADLVSKEIMRGSISRDGHIDGLMFDKPVRLSGRVATMCSLPAMCESRLLDAAVTVTRPSLFEGGPGFKALAMTEPGNDGPTFEVEVPPGNPDAPYVITIVPMPRGDSPPSGTTSLAEIVPPMRFALPLVENTTKTLTLGGLTLPTIEGTLLASAGGGLEDYRVVAMGRWESGAPLVEVSTVAYTGSNGAFHLTLSPDLTGSVEIVARPSDGMLGKPTLHLLDVPTAIGVQRTLTEPAALGSMMPKAIRIKSKDGSGAPKPVVGARVRVTALVGSAAEGTAVFVGEDTTDDGGIATLPVMSGILHEYRLEVVPLASASGGALYDEGFAMSSEEIQLPARTRLRGFVRDVNGDKLAGVTVTARPSLRFIWSLDDAPQTFVNAIPVSTAVTNEQGEYVIWVDPMVDETWGFYDLSLDPARSTGFLERAPTWVQPEVEIPRDAAVESVTVPDIWLPDAAFVHGQVIDNVGMPVKDAEVKVFRMNSYAVTVCETVRNAPVPCPASAQLLGRDAASINGIVELTLPR